MNIKRNRPTIRKSHLENEVILAVVILYVVLSAALLGIHHLQSPGNTTRTSSTSPSHDPTVAAPPTLVTIRLPAPLTRAGARQLLDADGFREIGVIHSDSAGFRTRARRNGKVWHVEIDAATRRISLTPGPAP